jgi:hypothetical protein
MMRSDARRLVISVGVAMATSVVLCGCIGPASIAESSTMGGLPDAAVTTPPPVSDDPLEDPLLAGQPRVGWLEDGESFAITFAGSSSCYAVPTGISAPTSGTIVLTVESTGGPACTADMTLRTHVIRTPEGVDPLLGAEVTAVGGTWVEVLPPLRAESPPAASIDLPVAVIIGPDGIATEPPEVVE